MSVLSFGYSFFCLLMGPKGTFALGTFFWLCVHFSKSLYNKILWMSLGIHSIFTTSLMRYYTSTALYIFTNMVPLKLTNSHEIRILCYCLHLSREKMEPSHPRPGFHPVLFHRTSPTHSGPGSDQMLPQDNVSSLVS